MPEIDLPTVIFALVALFVAWKLSSVLGMRQDSDRPGELAAPLRRAFAMARIRASSRPQRTTVRPAAAAALANATPQAPAPATPMTLTGLMSLRAAFGPLGITVRLRSPASDPGKAANPCS